jgi:hypothetical protein
MSPDLELPNDVIRTAVPDDDIVLAYVTRGALAKYVEGVAQTNDDFRAELEAVIDGLEDAGETVSLKAQAWRSRNTAQQPSVRTAKRRISFWAPVALAAAFLLVAGTFKVRADRADRIQAEKDREIAAKQADLDRLMRLLKEQQEAVAVAQAEAANAKDESDRIAAQAKLAAAQEQQRATTKSISAAAAGRPARTSNAKAACTCQAGDPLCSCL